MSNDQDSIRTFDSRHFAAVCSVERRGDAHLKNFGMLYTSPSDVRLSPMFDVVTTTIYKYERPGGVEAS